MANASTPDQKALAQLGQQVRERLARDPNVQRIPDDRIELYGVNKFLTLGECHRLIEIIDAGAQPSTVFEQDYSSGFRTSYSGNVDPHDPFIRMLERRIHDLMGIHPTFGETIQGQRYLPGQEFKPHHDYFHTSRGYWREEKARGGQRSWTAMAYLNETAEGGSTDFTQLGLSIPPQPGVMLIWNNMRPDGQPNPETLHTGTRVIEGSKYIITKWFRSRAWG